MRRISTAPRILLPDGAVRYVHSFSQPVFGSSGELVQFVGGSMDVTERKQADEAFRLIVVGTAATTGNDFFPSLVKHMAQVLRARYALWPPPERADQSRSSTRSRVNLALIGAARAAARIQSVESSRDHSRVATEFPGTAADVSVNITSRSDFALTAADFLGV